MGIPDIRLLVTLDFEVYGHVQGAIRKKNRIRNWGLATKVLFRVDG